VRSASSPSDPLSTRPDHSPRAIAEDGFAPVSSGASPRPRRTAASSTRADAPDIYDVLKRYAGFDKAFLTSGFRRAGLEERR
jgi:hypothetical protein